MTDNQKNIIGTILLNLSASTLPITEEMISGLVDMHDTMNTTMYGTPKMTPEEHEEVINELHATLFVRIDRGHFVKEGAIRRGTWQQRRKTPPNSGTDTGCIC